MKPTYLSAQKELHQSIRAWFNRPAGLRLMQLEQRLLIDLHAGLFGYYLVQIQGFGHSLACYDGLPVQYCLQLSLHDETDSTTMLYACSEMLPLATASIDVVVLPHTLDFSLDPHRVLKEVERVLIPEGRVIILGFNPISLWGLGRLFLQHRGGAPWTGHFLSYRRVNDWLSVLGFDIESSNVCAFAPPVSNETWAKRLDWLDARGKSLAPGLNGVYALRAVKRVSTVRPIRMRTQRLRAFGPSAATET